MTDELVPKELSRRFAKLQKKKPRAALLVAIRDGSPEKLKGALRGPDAARLITNRIVREASGRAALAAEAAGSPRNQRLIDNRRAVAEVVLANAILSTGRMRQSGSWAEKAKTIRSRLNARTAELATLLAGVG